MQCQYSDSLFYPCPKPATRWFGKWFEYTVGKPFLIELRVCDRHYLKVQANAAIMDKDAVRARRTGRL